MWLTSWGSRTSKRGRVTGCQWVLYWLFFFVFILRCYTFQYIFFFDQINISNIFPGIELVLNFFFWRVTNLWLTRDIVDKRHFRFFLTTGNWFDGALGGVSIWIYLYGNNIITYIFGVDFLLYIFYWFYGQLVVLMEIILSSAALTIYLGYGTW